MLLSTKSIGSLTNPPAAAPVPPLNITGDAARFIHRDDNDDYRQPGDLFRLMSSTQ